METDHRRGSPRRTVALIAVLALLLAAEAVLLVVSSRGGRAAPPVAAEASASSDEPVPPAAQEPAATEPVPEAPPEEFPPLVVLQHKFPLSRWSRKGEDGACDVAALRWLLRHQHADGSWDAREFPEQCDPELGERCRGTAREGRRAAVTGLVLNALACGGCGNEESLHLGRFLHGAGWLFAHADEFLQSDSKSNPWFHLECAWIAAAMEDVLHSLRRRDASVPGWQAAYERVVRSLESARLSAGGWPLAAGGTDLDLLTTYWATRVIDDRVREDLRLPLAGPARDLEAWERAGLGRPDAISQMHVYAARMDLDRRASSRSDARMEDVWPGGVIGPDVFLYPTLRPRWDPDVGLDAMTAFLGSWSAARG